MENQAYISHVHLKGYKSIRDMSVDLLPGLNIIIGPNGSGKTNFIEMINQSLSTTYLDFIDFNVEIEATELKGKRWDSKNITSKDKIAIHLNGFSSVDERYNQTLLITKKSFVNGKEIGDMTFNMRYDDNQNTFITTTNISQNEINIPHLYVEFGYPSYIFAITRLSQFGEIIEKGKRKSLVFLNKDFRTTDFFFDHILTNSILDAENIKDVIFKVSDNLRKNLSTSTPIKDIKFDSNLLSIRNDGNTRYYDNIQLLFLVENHWLKWNQLSDGTKRMFYIIGKITCLIENWDIVTIILEEPELGIHPDQLHLLMDFLKEQSKEKQIIITTHSPEVMNILEKDELDRIIVTRYDSENGTQMHKLSPHQIRKGQIYMKEVGYLSHYWVHSNLEEYEEQGAE